MRCAANNVMVDEPVGLGVKRDGSEKLREVGSPMGDPTAGEELLLPGVSLTEEKKSVPVPVFPKKPAGTPCAQPCLVAVGGWRLAAVGGWQLATGGRWRLVVGDWWLEAVGSGWQWLAVGGWSPLAVGGWWLAVGGGWWLAVGGGWQLMGVGGWRLVVPWGGP